MTSDISLTSALNGQNKTAAASTKLADDFTQFLTLLTVQLQNQDPLSPMDTTEFTNQLVAFTGVEQQINTNQKLDALVAMGLNNSFTAALNYVGLDVSYLASEFTHDPVAPSKITYSLDEQAITAKINIKDETGKVVYSADIEKAPGVHDFEWDGTLTTGGKAPAGTYSATIDALNTDDKAIKNSVVVSGRVRGVETQNGQLFVLVGERAVPVANILNASRPSEITPEEEDA